jgi:hypothetical protein
MSASITYPDEKQEPDPTDVEGLDSDGEASSFTALIAEGENSSHSTQHAKSVTVR